jgi:hypothetical protein
MKTIWIICYSHLFPEYARKGIFPALKFPAMVFPILKFLTLVLLSLVFLSTGRKVSAQPSLEYTYPISTSICNLEKSGDKYFAMDVTNLQCRIYNMDHSLYRTINLSVPADYYLYNIQHVSEHMFNQDDLIEFVYIYSKYNPTETSYYYSYETRVINENGLEVLKIPGAGYAEILETENGSRKFLVYVYDFYQVPSTTQTMVYSLPDEPMKSGPIQQQRRLGNPWPNPSRGAINIPVKLPPDAGPGVLILYNMHGQEVLRQVVDGEQEFIILPDGVLIPGTYVLKLKSEQGETQGKKFTIR